MDTFNNILITGGCGFVGSNFINYIYYKYNCNIINVDVLNYASNINNIHQEIRESDRYFLYKNDICDKENMITILNKHSIELIIHFAAQSHVTNSFNNSKQFIIDNIIGTHSLLEAVKIYNNLKEFIHISTDEVYGESNMTKSTISKTENTKLEPTNPYSASKAAAEMLVSSYIYSFKLPIKIVRCNNIYGKNQYPEKVIPKFIKQLTDGNEVTIEGNGNNKRTFIHVDDVADGIICVINKGSISEVYNIGNNNDEFSISELAEILIKKIKNNNNYQQYIKYIENRPYNDSRYYIDYTKLNNLGWRSNKKFMEEIDLLIKHYAN